MAFGPPKKLLRLFLSIGLFFAAFGNLAAQTPPELMQDKPAQENVKLAIDQIYGFNFDQTEVYLKKLRPKYNGHPVLPLLTAFNLYWKYMPVSMREKEFAEYKAALIETAELSNKILKRDSENTEAVFFQMMSMMMLAKLEGDVGEYGHAVNHARKAYVSIRKGFGLKSRYPEFYFTCGLYDYYREIYPEENPVYRPFMNLFMPGSKQKGIIELETASKKSVFTGLEALIFLTRINLYHENKPLEAVEFAATAIKGYPKNTIANLLYGEALCAAKRWNEAEGVLQKIQDTPNNFYRFGAEALLGLVAEKGDKNPKAAKVLYLKAIETARPYRKLGENHQGLSYAGLARIADAAGEKPKARAYYKKAFDLCSYRSVKAEAKAYLRE